MASYDKKKFQKTGKVQCYFFKNGKQVWISRNETRFLDHGITSNIDYFCHQLAIKYEGSATKNYGNTTKLVSSKTIEQFRKHLSERHDPMTVKSHMSCLVRFAIPFFENNDSFGPTSIDFQNWPDKSLLLTEFLQANGVSINVVRNVNSAVRKFWVFLQQQKVM